MSFSGDLLRKRRRELGLSRTVVAFCCGRDVETVARWERGTTRPQHDDLERVAAVLVVEPEELCVGGAL